MALTAILVEDSKTIRDNLIPALSDLAGVKVVAIAETEDEALKAFYDHPDWELAIVDLFLREGTGLTVLRGCQDRKSHQHAIVLTNYPTHEVRKRCMEVGADAVYDKSQDLDAFFERCLQFQ